MMFLLMRVLLFISGLLIIGFGLSFFILGPGMTFELLLQASKPFLINPGPVSDVSTPGVDGEIRTLAPFLIGYGVLVFMVAKHLRTHIYYVPHLLAIFFVAGIGRVISYIVMGPPHPIFYVLMAIELGAPIVLFILLKITMAELKLYA